MPFIKRYYLISRYIILFLTFTFSTLNCIGQERPTSEFGLIFPTEESLKIYEPDTTAAAVVLYEQGHYYYKDVGGSFFLYKEVYKKIKVFNAQQADLGVIDIPIYTSEDSSEMINGFRAQVHNGKMRTILSEDAVFVTRDADIGPVFRMIMPNVQDGSIIEYAYRIKSNALFNLDSWYFQDEIPKIYSELIVKIPSEIRFRNIVYGSQALDTNRNELTNDCLQTDYNRRTISCPISLYAMRDIPAFKDENYMLSAKNYLSRIEFEPKEFSTPAGWTKKMKFSTTWKDVDKLFKKGDLIGNQLSKSNYFKRNLPESILLINNPLEKAKAIYTFIQDHYTWNGDYYSSETQVKDAFDSKKGSIPEINISLINALNAAGFDAKLLLLSTRENGLPTQDYPIVTKFNYTVAYLKIDDSIFLLDATDKQAAFGIIPFRALNVQGRVMDFDEGSFWTPIEPFTKNIHFTNAQVSASINGNFIGKVSEANYGYISLEKRTELAATNVEDYKKEKANIGSSIDIENYEIENIEAIEEPLKATYDVIIEPEIVGNKTLLYPFFIDSYISENPFNLNERKYAIDLGFPFTNTYIISLDLGEIYSVENLPDSRTVKLPNDDGELTVTYSQENGKINIRLNFKMNSYRFRPEAYESLKELFSTLIQVLKSEPITLKKL